LPARCRSLSLAAALCCAATGTAHCEDATSPEELAFNNHCRECHTVDPGDNRIGPTLYDIVGRRAGSLAGFPNYSSAVQDSGIVWNASTLDKWIANPSAFLPDNNMAPFAGVTAAKDRALIIAYLTSKSPDATR